MTVPELIALVLESICNQFYADRVREFKRDENALVKAVSFYGYECDRRGWEFDEKFLLHDIMELLQEIKRSGVEIKYLPVYLTGAVRKRIGQRAEEYNAQAKSLRARGIGTTRAERLRAPAIPAARLVKDVVNGAQVVTAVREKSGAETLADVYRTIRKHGKKTRAGTAAQKALLLILLLLCPLAAIGAPPPAMKIERVGEYVRVSVSARRGCRVELQVSRTSPPVIWTTIESRVADGDGTVSWLFKPNLNQVFYRGRVTL